MMLSQRTLLGETERRALVPKFKRVVKKLCPIQAGAALPMLFWRYCLALEASKAKKRGMSVSWLP